jgi:stage V sporulation protein SpoVS
VIKFLEEESVHLSDPAAFADIQVGEEARPAITKEILEIWFEIFKR